MMDVEYGTLYISGAVLVWASDNFDVYPLKDRIKHAQRSGSKVFKRTITVISDWEEVE